MLRAGRLVAAEDHVIHSPPRIRLAELSPMTQRSASTTLTSCIRSAPRPGQPFLDHQSVGSTNDLNPESLSFENFNVGPLPDGGGV